MRHSEFYSKYKTNHQSIVTPIFSKRNWWSIILVSVVAILAGPLVFIKDQGSFPFSFDHYLKLSAFFVVIIVPFVSFLLWTNWRESIIQKSGYGWVGKFEVIGKQSKFAFKFLLLSPGKRNRMKVSLDMFERTRIGDFLLIYRDSFGRIEKVNKVKNLPSRLSRIESKRLTVN